MNWIEQFYERFYPHDIGKKDNGKAFQLKRKTGRPLYSTIALLILFIKKS